MKYQAKELSKNVNVSEESPLKEFSILAAALVAITAIAYFTLGSIVDGIINLSLDYIPQDWDIELNAPISVTAEKDKSKEFIHAQDSLQELLDNLIAHSNLAGRKYQVILVENKEMNAFAYPGGKIFILSGLLRKLKYENELAMVLGHELGHFANRDHIRSMGRQIVMAFFSSLFFGSQEDVGIAELTLQAASGSNSRNQETDADVFGLDTIENYYGHVGGALAFYRIAEAEGSKQILPAIARSHPYADMRIKMLEKLIKEKGYQTRESKNFDKRLTNYLNK